MKIRNGFVSNSSSSSFCIFGVRLEDDFLIEALNIKDDEELYDLELKGLNIHRDGEGQCCYIGRDLISIKDNETGKEFKDGVKSLLRKYFGKDIACEMIQEEIYN